MTNLIRNDSHDSQMDYRLIGCGLPLSSDEKTLTWNSPSMLSGIRKINAWVRVTGLTMLQSLDRGQISTSSE